MGINVYWQRGGLLDTKISKERMAELRKSARRQSERRAAYGLADHVTPGAKTDLLKEAALAVQGAWPRDVHHVRRLLWPAFSKYAECLRVCLREVLPFRSVVTYIGFDAHVFRQSSRMIFVPPSFSLTQLGTSSTYLVTGRDISIRPEVLLDKWR